MRIAVTYDNGNVMQHFGRTEAFLLCDVENNEIIFSRVVGTNGQGHGMLPPYLASLGVNTVICGGLGQPMVQAVKSCGMELVAGASGDALEAAKAYLAGTLISNPNAAHACDHHH